MELHISHEEGYVLANTSGPIDESSGDLFGEYLHPLVGRVGIADRGADGNHVETGIFFPDHTAFEAGVDGLDDRLAAESFLINRLALGQQG